MSITSVGASFGYIDPASVAGPTQSATASGDTDDAPSPASSSGKSDDSSTGSNPTPTPTPPQATSSDGPKFSPATGAALVQVQEKANAA